MDDPLEVSQKGLFYSPPKAKLMHAEGRSRSDTSGSDSSITALIIPEENSTSEMLEQLEGKYSSRNPRHSFRHKHKQRHERHYKAG